ncbi:MAG: hypothetical protein KUG77_04740, partial [Nannocystaceae bacterium]|nr:hypothetical protein [Nannocystaceae bacterium]
MGTIGPSERQGHIGVPDAIGCKRIHGEYATTAFVLEGGRLFHAVLQRLFDESLRPRPVSYTHLTLPT